jgi:hypothetical protein
MFASWAGLTLEAARFGFDVQRVISLRMMRMAAGGPAAKAEAYRMVTEKAAALAEASAILATGGSGSKVARRYRSHVRANKRRLSRPKTRR